MVYKRVRDWTLERGFPYKTLLSIPSLLSGASSCITDK